MKRILVVDDLEQERSRLEASLKDCGYDTISVRDGTEALAAARRQRPDLVISNILMTGMDGFALCREWRADVALRGIPFIIHAFPSKDSEDEQRALAAGADRFVLKPQDPQATKEIVREVLFESLEKRLSELEADHQQLVENARQQQATEEALRQSQEQFQRLFESGPLGTALFSASDGCILNVNARFLELIKCSQEEVVGAHRSGAGRVVRSCRTGPVAGAVAARKAGAIL